jgi:hypothetical protein
MCSKDLNLAYQFTKIRADVQIKLTFKVVFGFLYHQETTSHFEYFLADHLDDSIYIITNSLSSFFINFISTKILMQ